MGKPRMVKSDAWRKRPCVEKYWQYKDKLRAYLPDTIYEVPPVLEDIQFVLPMPKSWSKKKKAEMSGLPHQQKPDLDNIIKGFKDCLCENDSYVWQYNRISKVWGYEGMIIIEDT